MHVFWRVIGLAPVIALCGIAGAARAEDLAAFYRATWAGLPAAEVRLNLGGTDSSYRDEIQIETQGRRVQVMLAVPDNARVRAHLIRSPQGLTATLPGVS